MLKLIIRLCIILPSLSEQQLQPKQPPEAEAALSPEEVLKASYYELYKQQVEIKIQTAIHPLNRSIEKLRKHKLVADSIQDQKQRTDWIKAAEFIITSIKMSPISEVAIVELQKANQLKECLDRNVVSDNKALESGVKFKFNEQNPDFWIKLADDRVSRLVKLFNEMVKIADDCSS